MEAAEIAGADRVLAGLQDSSNAAEPSPGKLAQE
jgi:hypothetical protein